MIPIKKTYRTSAEKWQIIKEFITNNELDDSCMKMVDAMLAYIEIKGDICLIEPQTLEIFDSISFADSSNNTDYHPCPHCKAFKTCENCPLFDWTESDCCKSWCDVNFAGALLQIPDLEW